MPLAKVGARHQVTLPKEIVEELHLKPGDYVEVTRAGDRILLVPKAVVDRTEAWCLSEEWQQKEQEADEDIKAGRVKSFTDVEKLIKDLNR